MDCIRTDGSRESAVGWYADIAAISEHPGKKGLELTKLYFEVSFISCYVFDLSENITVMEGNCLSMTVGLHVAVTSMRPKNND